MPEAFKLGFAPFALPARGVLIVFCNDGVQLGPTTRDLLGNAAGMVRKAATAERFKGKLGSTLDIVLPAGLQATRLVVVGCGQASELKGADYLRLGGIAIGKVPAAAGDATILAELPGWERACASIHSTNTRPSRATMNLNLARPTSPSA